MPSIANSLLQQQQQQQHWAEYTAIVLTVWACSDLLSPVSCLLGLQGRWRWAQQQRCRCLQYSSALVPTCLGCWMCASRLCRSWHHKATAKSSTLAASRASALCHSGGLGGTRAHQPAHTGASLWSRQCSQHHQTAWHNRCTPLCVWAWEMHCAHHDVVVHLVAQTPRVMLLQGDLLRH